MSFKNYFYVSIGKRIKRLRLDQRFVQFDIAIDTPILSKIENGIADEKKNPYLLNAKQIKTLCQKLNVNQKTLIWGSEPEQENFVKLLLLTLLMNGKYTDEDNSINPFCSFDNDYELLLWSRKQNNIPLNLRENINLAIMSIEDELQKIDSEYTNLRKEVESLFPEKIYPYANNYQFFFWAHRQKILKENKTLEEKVSSAISSIEKETISYKKMQQLKNIKCEVDDYFTSKYPFFYNKENYIHFTELFTSTDSTDSTDTELQKISDVLFKVLLQNYNFAKGYITRTTNYIFNTPNKKKDFVDTIKDFLIHSSFYPDIALDFKEKEYYLFIDAFNRMWQSHSKEYMAYFTEYLFNIDFSKYGLKKLITKDFNNIINSNKLYEICNNIKMIDYYNNPETILANYYSMLTIQEVLQRHNAYLDKNNEIFFKYLSDFLIKTDECAKALDINK